MVHRQLPGQLNHRPAQQTKKAAVAALQKKKAACAAFGFSSINTSVVYAAFSTEAGSFLSSSANPDLSEMPV